ncbi:PREDICTED: serine protease snake-like [Papilio polytes]|uniref:serine protease snake-like n=1 Tax=Papilio polytes TaxID=76194 RepID=UPI0006767481|nr:PREDICTED: serine protease snake-like [Papilio polytes]
MKCDKILLTFLLITLIVITVKGISPDNLNESKPLSRSIRQYKQTASGNNKFHSISTFGTGVTAENNTNDENNPCIYKELEKPVFKMPGPRISGAKCYEYIWELENRRLRNKQERDCFTYIYERLPNKPHFAIGGRITEPGEFPHMGAVGWRSSTGTWIFKCGSSLISSKFMLTAAHCSKVSPRDTSVANQVPEIVRLGDKNIIDTFSNGLDPVDVKIKRIINHPLYKPPKKYNDIAIIELEKDVDFTKYVQPACLWPRHDTSPLGSKATLTGWGVIETARLITSPELQAAEVDILSSDICDKFLEPSCTRLWCRMNETQLCAGKLTGGVDACQGDSGGPLQVKIDLPSNSEGAMHYVIGVTSFGIGCARANTPGVYTRVSSFIDWIENVVWGAKN